jgi:hypothetical protein
VSRGLDKIIEDLRRLGILDSYEGKADLPGGSSAPIWRLRRGGLALLLDELEGHRFLAVQTQRFRAVIVRGPEGRPLVVRRYEDFVTDEVSGPGE